MVIPPLRQPGEALRLALVIALASLHAILGVTATAEKSMTSDEIAHLTAGHAYNTRGDFRLQLATGPGRYRLTGMVKTAGIVAGKEENSRGLRVRLSGMAGVQALTGSNSWRTVSLEFSVDEADPVIVLEMRADAGQAWFDRNSLTLTRIP